MGLDGQSVWPWKLNSGDSARSEHAQNPRSRRRRVEIVKAIGGRLKPAPRRPHDRIPIQDAFECRPVRYRSRCCVGTGKYKDMGRNRALSKPSGAEIRHRRRSAAGNIGQEPRRAGTCWMVIRRDRLHHPAKYAALLYRRKHAVRHPAAWRANWLDGQPSAAAGGSGRPENPVPPKRDRKPSRPPKWLVKAWLRRHGLIPVTTPIIAPPGNWRRWAAWR